MRWHSQPDGLARRAETRSISSARRVRERARTQLLSQPIGCNIDKMCDLCYAHWWCEFDSHGLGPVSTAAWQETHTSAMKLFTTSTLLCLVPCWIHTPTQAKTSQRMSTLSATTTNNRKLMGRGDVAQHPFRMQIPLVQLLQQGRRLQDLTHLPAIVVERPKPGIIKWRVEMPTTARWKPRKMSSRTGVCTCKIKFTFTSDDPTTMATTTAKGKAIAKPTARANAQVAIVS